MMIRIKNKQQHAANHSHFDSENKHTYTGFIDSDIESINQVFQECADQTEIEPADTPRAIHQNDDIGDCRCGAHKLVHYRVIKEKQRAT